MNRKFPYKHYSFGPVEIGFSKPSARWIEKFMCKHVWNHFVDGVDQKIVPDVGCDEYCIVCGTTTRTWEEVKK